MGRFILVQGKPCRDRVGIIDREGDYFVGVRWG